MSTSADGPPVYLLTIDSLRVDFFDEDRFPSCWEYFVDDFVRFSKAYANGIATPLAFPSILANDHVTGNGAVDPDATTLAEMLPDPSVAVRNNVHLSQERGYHRGFSHFDIDIDAPGYVERALTLKCFRRNGVESVRRKLPFLGDPDAPILYRPAERMVYEITESIRSTSPSFLWGHFMDPHGPYHPKLVFDRELSVAFDGFEGVHERWKADDRIDGDTIAKLREVYEEKIGYLDRRLVKLFEWLERAGRYDEALIVITADHGQLIGEGNRFGHDWDNLPVDELLRVPLLVKFPEGVYAGETFSHRVQHLDIHSTIAQRILDDPDVHPESRPLTDPGNRRIIAKSNSAIRGISESGEVIREIGGAVEVNGNPPPDLVERVKSAEPARVTNDVGQGTLSEEERERVNEQLEELGYL